MELKINGEEKKITAYGTDACYKLANNRFPFSEEGRHLESKLATTNADNYAFIAAGTFY